MQHAIFGYGQLTGVTAIFVTWAALSYWARRYDSAIWCSNMSIFVHVAAANSRIVPSCSV